ncbi:MAG: hypothetical protein EOO09_20470 [Chitinophagaceae bacterium]|nr:MAG: hypothetical protein EOO09_20470 [Chitinophagaceae bacterium]
MKFLSGLSVFCLLSTPADAQSVHQEFEGIITYKIILEAKLPDIKLERLKKSFGTTIEYFFKDGRYKWTAHGTDLEIEIFDPHSSLTSVVDKLYANDTLYFSDTGSSRDTVTNVTPGNPMDILGITCKSAVFTVLIGGKSDRKLIRTLYYSPDTLQYNTDYYRAYRGHGQNIVSRYLGAHPLRTELNFVALPFKIVYEAVSIESRKLTVAEFAINPALPSKSW